MKWAINIFAAIGGVLAVVGCYELLLKERYVPYASGYFDPCEKESRTVAQLEELGNLVYSNAGGAVFLDFDFMQTCETAEIEYPYFFLSLGDTYENSIKDDGGTITFTIRPTVEYAPQVSITAQRPVLSYQPLSRIQPGLTEFSGDRLYGLFFLKANLAAGEYTVDLLPVGYSDALQEKFSCSKAMADAQGLQSKIISYVGACILKTARPDW